MRETFIQGKHIFNHAGVIFLYGKAVVGIAV